MFGYASNSSKGNDQLFGSNSNFIGSNRGKDDTVTADKQKLTDQVKTLTDDKTNLTNQINALTDDKINLKNQVNTLTILVNEQNETLKNLNLKLIEVTTSSTQQLDELNINYEYKINKIISEKNDLKKEIETIILDSNFKDLIYKSQKEIFQDAHSQYREIINFYESLSKYENEQLSKYDMGIRNVNENFKDLLKKETSTFLEYTKKNLIEIIGKEKEILNNQLSILDKCLEDLKRLLLEIPDIYSDENTDENCIIHTISKIKSRKDQYERWGNILMRL